MIEKKQIYQRHAIYSIPYVLSILDRTSNSDKKKKITLGGHVININSLKLKTFLKYGTNCSCCSLKGKYFALESFEHEEFSSHLNLYGIDKNNNEILFTHDHTLARGLGGLDDISNTKTMCYPCNINKSKIESTFINFSRSFFKKHTKSKQLTQDKIVKSFQHFLSSKLKFSKI